MDEGSALLHHLERRFNLCLSCLVYNGGITGALHRFPNTKDCICVVGFDGSNIDAVQKQLSDLIKSWVDIPHITGVEQHVLEEDLSGEDFSGASYVMLCCSAEDAEDNYKLCRLLQAYRLAKARKAKTFLLLIRERPDVSDSKELSDSLLRDCQLIQDLSQHNPEVKILNRKQRIQLVLRDHKYISMETITHLIHDWLRGSVFEEPVDIEHLDYKDIYRIYLRDARLWMPELGAFLRIFLMCLFGCLSVLLTLLILVLLSQDVGLASDAKRAQLFLRSALESQRSGKSEWRPPDDVIALTALQIHQPSWCFEEMKNGRSVDRMEINLLSLLSKIHSRPRRHLPATQLASYILALLSTHQNPREFHGHDLVSAIEYYLVNKLPFEAFNNFAYAHCLIALCGAGAELTNDHLTRLLQRMRPDGTFPLGIDEASMTTLALQCYPKSELAANATKRAVENIITFRTYEGSFAASPYSTALALQALNASGYTLDSESYSKTITWLVTQAWTPHVSQNVHVASHVLIALSNKTLLSAKQHSVQFDDTIKRHGLSGHLHKYIINDLDIQKQGQGSSKLEHQASYIMQEYKENDKVSLPKKRKKISTIKSKGYTLNDKAQHLLYYITQCPA